MEALPIITMITSVLSLAALIVAGVLTLRLQELRKHTHANTWHTYFSVRALLRSLPKDTVVDATIVPVLRTRIEELHRQLVKQIALLQDRYDLDTIRSWRETGNVETDWEEQEFRRFLQQGLPPRRQNTGKSTAFEGSTAPGGATSPGLPPPRVSKVDSGSTSTPA